MGNLAGRPYSSPGSGHISRKELDRLQRRFSRLSQNTDRVPIQQLAAVPELSGNPFVQRLFELHDMDGDGIITHEEFLTTIMTLSRTSSPQDKLSLAFDIFDLNGDGYIDECELTKVLRHTTASGMPEAQLAAAVHQIVAAHDADGDGRLDLGEFSGLVFSSVEQRPAAFVST